uniref:Uncharacterized protein n=1 Tax=Rhizophora mucronata TaxID=61149 RepID=A0A2P2IUH7_RHIMU
MSSLFLLTFLSAKNVYSYYS